MIVTWTRTERLSCVFSLKNPKSKCNQRNQLNDNFHIRHPSSPEVTLQLPTCDLEASGRNSYSSTQSTKILQVTMSAWATPETQNAPWLSVNSTRKWRHDDNAKGRISRLMVAAAVQTPPPAASILPSESWVAELWENSHYSSKGRWENNWRTHTSILFLLHLHLFPKQQTNNVLLLPDLNRH